VTQVLISLGSNIDKERQLPAALALLDAYPRLTVLSVSPVLQTAAVGADGQPAAQPAFHNQAVLAETSLAQDELRALLRAIETQLGRVRTPDKFAPRPIDLDLSAFGETLADPAVLRYAHVAIPLAAVAPTWVHAATGTTLAEIAAGFTAGAQTACA
jgi:2-amino-4-hydroxy-6-hydroxymethyldihydropteridine diphosphokinase